LAQEVLRGQHRHLRRGALRRVVRGLDGVVAKPTTAKTGNRRGRARTAGPRRLEVSVGS